MKTTVAVFILVVLIFGSVFGNHTFSVNFHDTYYVASWFHVASFIVFLTCLFYLFRNVFSSFKSKYSRNNV